MVGDHLYISRTEKSCTAQLLETALAAKCAVSAVQATHESKLPFYGCIGGSRVQGSDRLYEVETVIEKPTPTEAEQKLVVPGLRAGNYLCFFGMHVLTPSVMEILGRQLAEGPRPTCQPPSRKPPAASATSPTNSRAAATTSTSTTACSPPSSPSASPARTATRCSRCSSNCSPNPKPDSGHVP